MTVTSALEQLEKFEAGPTNTRELMAFFDTLPPALEADMMGRWRGSGFKSGHPMDGLLERFGWYGKAFLGPDEVHPLLFGQGERVYALDPAFMPMEIIFKYIGIFHTKLMQAIFVPFTAVAKTRKPRARLRMVAYRGVATAAMIYDHLPIQDMFHVVDENTRLGVMDLRGMAEPFFFVLRRA